MDSVLLNVVSVINFHDPVCHACHRDMTRSDTITKSYLLFKRIEV